MTGKTHTSSQPHQAKFDTDIFSIGIDNIFSVSMLHSNQKFVVPLKKGCRFINGFEGPKIHTIYEDTIAWTINEDSGHNHRVETSNYLYLPRGREWLISPQHWSHNATPANVDDTDLDGTWCDTNHDHATLIWGYGRFIRTVPLEKKIVFTLHTAPVYTAPTEYCAPFTFTK